MGGFEQGYSRHNDEGVHRDYQKEAERLAESARKFGFATIVYDNEYILNSEYYNDHLDVLTKTSFGFAYKAICLYDTMKIMDFGDIVFWADSNHLVQNDPHVFINTVIKYGVFLRDHIWVYYPNMDWCRRDTFVNMGCDTEEYYHFPQLQDNVFGMCKNETTFRFAKEWMDCCLDYNIMFGNNEYPNFPTFKEHRHNQAIFSNLVCKYKFPFLNRTENVWNEYIIPEIDIITPEYPIDHSHRKDQDLKDIR
jgi:hypothetical protein